MKKLLRMTDVTEMIGLKKSAVYKMVNDGVLTKPIKMGKKVSLWPDYEIQTIIDAIIENRNQDELKTLVNNLMESRSKVSRL